ncbi:MAG: pitrilysin family protein [Caulobacteraceae bacterium]
MAARVHQLSNGATVICDAAAGYETFALSVVAGRGARCEPKNRSGWSHLLEHMVFKGAGQRSARDIVEEIEARGGSINAATGYERTSFQVRALRGSLGLGLSVVSDLIQRPVFDPLDLAKEKQVVAQEIAEAADTPDDLVFELAQEKAFGGHALARPVLGTAASLAPADPASMEGWRAALYAPDRLVISASGAVDEDELLRLAEREFGASAGKGADPEPDATFAGGHASQARKLEQAHLVFLLPSVGLTDPDYYASRLFAEALGGGMSSRLFQEAREKLGLAYNIDAFADAYPDVGVMGVYAGCAAKDAARLAEVAGKELKSLAASIDEAELARCKAQMKASLFMSNESLAARAELAASQYLVFGRVLSNEELAASVDRVTVADVARLGARLLAPGQVAAAVLGPKPSLSAGTAFEAALN